MTFFEFGHRGEFQYLRQTSELSRSKFQVGGNAFDETDISTAILNGDDHSWLRQTGRNSRSRSPAVNRTFGTDKFDFGMSEYGSTSRYFDHAAGVSEAPLLAAVCFISAIASWTASTFSATCLATSA